MNVLASLRIGTRLVIGFAIVLIFSIISTLFALVGANRNAESTKVMMLVPLAKERLVSDWSAQTFAAVTRTGMIAQSTDDNLALTFGKDIADSVTRGTELLKKIEPLLNDEAEKTIFRDTIAFRAKFQAATLALTDAKQTGSPDAVAQLYAEQFAPMAERYRGKIGELLAYQRKTIDAAAAEIARANSRSTQWAVALSALLIVLGALCAWIIARSITLPLKAAIAIASTVANGDLTTRFGATGARDEIGDLMRALKEMNGALNKIVSEVQHRTESIGAASSEIAAGTQDLSERTEQQASSLEETASSMEQLAATVRQNADNATQANRLALAASEVAAKGGDIVGQVVETMGSIDASAKKIVDIISLIDGIAFQTNILALNAAVEAARAGEQGRGFAVVAAEVRNLAQRSAGAAKEIKTLIGDSFEQVNNGTRLVQQAGTTMEEVVSSVRRVTDIMAEITAASHEQSDGIGQVNQAITQMDQVTQQNAALVEEAAAAAECLQDQSAQLARAAAGFKLDAAAQPPRLAAGTAARPPAAASKLASAARLGAAHRAPQLTEIAPVA
jgi:methyl-accepting chemotaxis protein